MSARKGSPGALPAAAALRGTDAHERGCEVLAVFAHPDDESLLAGGTLAACAASGLAVGIVSLTHGELGAMPGGAGAGADGERLACVRAAELADAATALGAGWALCLDFADGELRFADRARAGSALRELAGERPQAVLTFSAEGLYWHPDHIAAHEIVHNAFAGELVCELSWPEGLLPRVVRELRSRELPSDVWGLDPRAFGAPAEAIAHELDVSPFLETKLRALRCHRSQLLAGHALADLPDDLARDLLGREWLGACGPAEWLAERVVAGSAAGRHA